MEASNLERFFSGVEERLQQMRLEFGKNVKNFFVELNPALEAARKLDREMNRIFAHRFNVLDYMRTDELGLSRVIADLFNPFASHGQGTFFLQLFLRQFLENKTQTRFDTSWLEFKSKDVRVIVEKEIENDRRIDIYVTIKKSRSKVFCLAIENKPYAGDQYRQISDYLKHLEGNFKENFLLIYLPSRGQMPSEYSLESSEYKIWEGRFKVMAYYTGNESSSVEFVNLESENGEQSQSNDQSIAQYEKFQLPFSLIDWLSSCRIYCEVDRLRSFLRDVEQFCLKRFGDNVMINDNEVEAVKEVIFSGDTEKNLEVAMIVAKAWPNVFEKLIHDYMDLLHKKIREKVDSGNLPGDCQVEVHKGVKRYQSGIWLFRSSWKQYGGTSETRRGTTAIYMQNQGEGPSDWIFGVVSPTPSSKMWEIDKERRDKLKNSMDKEFRGWKSSDWWLCYKSVDPRDWKKIVLELRSEWKNGGGDRTEKFVDTFIEIARLAIPLIDEIEK